MKNLLLLKNKFILISALIVTISGCGYAYQENPKPKTDKLNSGKTKTKSAIKKSTGSASTSTAQPVKPKETKKEKSGTEIKHQSDDQKKLDSLKNAKDKGKGIK